MANPAMPVPDLYGRALVDHMKGRRLPVHLRRGDGRLVLLDFEQYATGGPDGFSLVERLLIPEAHGAVLDLGAGGGRVAAHLQSMSERDQAVSEVVAVDASQGACSCLRRRGLRAVVHSPWQRVMESGIWHGRFDTVILAGGNLGLAGDPQGLGALMEWVAGLLKPGGILLATGGSLWPPTPENQMQPVKLRIEYAGKVGEWFSWLSLTPACLSAAATPCGLRVVRWVFPPEPGEYGVQLAKVRPEPELARELDLRIARQREER